MKEKEEKRKKTERVRLVIIAVLSIAVIITGSLFAVMSFRNGEIAGGIIGILIAIIILGFALYVYIKGRRDLKEGFPLKDERSKRVIEKASSMAFFVSLYVLLFVGWLSDSIIPFRDVSQASGVTIGLMAILFAIFWAYFNKKEI